MLGPDFAGVLVSDCLATYDDVNPRQQKCYSHHLKAVRLAGEGQPSAWLEEVRWLLQEAMTLKQQTLEDAERRKRRADLEQRATELLAKPRPTNTEDKLRRRLEKQRDHLFTFLDVAEVDATNKSGRTPIAAGRHRPQSLLRQQHAARRSYLGNHRQPGRHLSQAFQILCPPHQPKPHPLTHTLNTYRSRDRGAD